MFIFKGVGMKYHYLEKRGWQKRVEEVGKGWVGGYGVGVEEIRLLSFLVS